MLRRLGVSMSYTPPSEGKWLSRSSTFLFDGEAMQYGSTAFDEKDPFMVSDGHATIVGGEEDTNEDCDEILEHVPPAPPTMEDAPPVPRTFIADDGQVFSTEELMLERNKELVGCKLLPMRSRSINRPSHVSGSSRRRESRSPIRPPR
jgi:hypothetical protein